MIIIVHPNQLSLSLVTKSSDELTVDECVSFIIWFWQEPWFCKALSTGSWWQKVCLWNRRILQCWAVGGAFSELSHHGRRNRFWWLFWLTTDRECHPLLHVDHPLALNNNTASSGLYLKGHWDSPNDKVVVCLRPRHWITYPLVGNKTLIKLINISHDVVQILLYKT